MACLRVLSPLLNRNLLMIKNLLIAQVIFGLIVGIGTIIGWAIYRKVTKKPICFSCRYLKQYNPQKISKFKCKPPDMMFYDYYEVAPEYCADYCPFDPSENPETIGGTRDE